MDAVPNLQKIAIIGATGATGREIVKYLAMPSKDGYRCAEMTLIIRKKLPEWEE